jgi:5'-hydroxyaverantin dehydrogenase
VTSWPELIAAFKAAVSFSPQHTVDIVIPNAGVAGPSLAHWLMATPKDEAGDPLAPPSRVTEVNYTAVFNTVHAAMYFFKAHPGDDHFPASAAAAAEATADKPAPPTKLIVLVASMGGYQPMPSVLNYNSAKWGVRGLFWSLRDIERILGPRSPGFRVNLIAPTWVRTNMTKGFVARAGEASESPFKIAEVSDCVDVVLRMAADESVKGESPHSVSPFWMVLAGADWGRPCGGDRGGQAELRPVRRV